MWIQAERVNWIFTNMKRNFLGKGIGFIFYFLFYTILVFEFSTAGMCYLYKFFKKIKEKSSNQQPRVIKRILANAFRNLGSLPEVRRWQWIIHFILWD